MSGPNTLDTGKIKKGNDGIGKKLVRLRSEDEVFSDAAADFSDNGPNPGIKEPLQEDNLDSSTSVEKVDIKDPIFSGSPKNSDFINGKMIGFTTQFFLLYCYDFTLLTEYILVAQ